MKRTKLLVIIGPTASGKTGLGIDLAKRFDGEVISVDSRQIYRGMDIGTAKAVGEKVRIGTWRLGHGLPTALVVDGVPHWGIDIADPDTEYSVADFKKYADEKIADIASRGKLPILVGGTGLWVCAVIDNLNLTETPPDWELRARLEARPLGDLFAEYKRLDPDGAELIDRQNKRRVVRALEVTLATGKPFSKQIEKGNGKYDALEIGILVDRDALNERINGRVDEMVASGLINEVRRLRDAYGCEHESMTGIGYRQICAWLDSTEFSSTHGAPAAEHPAVLTSPFGSRSARREPCSSAPMGRRIGLADAIEEIKKATRAYAKRQMTWFKRDDRIQWIRNPEDAVDLVIRFLA
jgi:tRNA dimethylallyltransferase